MKKGKLFLLTIALCTTGNLFSQKSGNNEKEFVNVFEADKTVWTFMYYGCPNDPNEVRYTILHGDTVMNNIKWKIFTSEPFIPKGLVRAEGNKVFFLAYPGYEYYVSTGKNGKEAVIYDFSLNVGDSVITSFYGTSSKEEITEVNSVMLNDGKQRKQIKFGNFFKWSIIDGFGSYDTEPFFMLKDILLCESPPSLICCHVNDELLYLSPAYLDCDGNMVDNETIVTDRQKTRIIFVNEELKVSFEDDAPFDVSVFNLQGMVIIQRKSNQDEVIIPLNKITQGIYIVQVTSGEYKYTQKLIR